MPIKVLPGSPYPQGATWDGTGVNFALYSESATRVDLCLFDTATSDQHDTIELHECTGHVWHCYLPGLTIGQLYGYRIHGPYEPEKGLRFNPAKLVIDPYAKAIAGKVNWDYPIFGYRLGDPAQDLSCDPQDDAGGMPKGVVTASQFDWQNDRAPAIQLHDSLASSRRFRSQPQEPGCERHQHDRPILGLPLLDWGPPEVGAKRFLH
jgi:isoamylase